jgi:hypothetical protein
MQGLRESLHDKDLLLANDGSVMVRAGWPGPGRSFTNITNIPSLSLVYSRMISIPVIPMSVAPSGVVCSGRCGIEYTGRKCSYGKSRGGQGSISVYVLNPGLRCTTSKATSSWKRSARERTARQSSRRAKRRAGWYVIGGSLTVRLLCMVMAKCALQMTHIRQPLSKRRPYWPTESGATDAQSPRDGQMPLSGP